MTKTDHSAVYFTYLINVLMSNLSRNVWGGGEYHGNLFQKNSKTGFTYYVLRDAFFFPENLEP